jgi:hypothetical protein
MSILDSEDIWVCGDCGSEDVYEAVWMEINGTGGGEPVGDGQSWCEECQYSTPFTHVIPKAEYLKRKQEEE